MAGNSSGGPLVQRGGTPGQPGFVPPHTHALSDVQGILARMGAVVRATITVTIVTPPDGILTITLTNLDGTPYENAATIRLLAYDTSKAGSSDLATNCTFTTVGTGTLVSGLNTNDLVLVTAADGTAAVVATDNVAETVYFAAFSYGLPTPATGFAIGASPEASGFFG